MSPKSRLYALTLVSGRQRFWRPAWLSADGNCITLQMAIALDILKRQYDALPDQRLLAFQSPYMEKMPNMKLHLLGNVGYMTTDPKNVEAILNTNLRVRIDVRFRVF